MFTIKIILISYTIKTIMSAESVKPVTLQLDPEKIIDTFKSLMSSQYVKTVAEEIASQAAMKFMEEMKQNQKLEGKYHPERTLPLGHAEPHERVEAGDASALRDTGVHKPEKLQSEDHKNVLDEQVAMTLIKDPSPDGDDLDLDSLEQAANKGPVIALPQKINGKYMRRLLRKYNDLRWRRSLAKIV